MMVVITLDKNYTVLHCHTEQSLLDSCTNYKLYIDKAKELGQKAIAFTEHGNIYNWVDKKMYCDKQGVKYIHGIEIYLTYSHDTKVRDNYHTILIAKNYEGFKELNILIDLSTQEDHFYYKPRLSFDEFLNISNNIIKISACLGSPIRKFPKVIAELDDDEKRVAECYYEKLLNHYDYYEIQAHPHIDQIDFNNFLYEMSKKYNKPLSVGTDTHNLNTYKAECRTILQRAKKIIFDNEDEFDLTYKSYDELVEMFKIQNSLPLDIVKEALNNTNLISDSIETFELDTSFKYPILYDNEEEVLITTINKKYEDKLKRGVIKENPRYKSDIKEELRVFKKIGMVGFVLFMSELMTWCRENDIPTSPCRGSVGGSTIAYLIDIIDVDPIVWNTIFSRFCNEDRIEIGDIDVDISPDQRELVYDYIIKRFGIDYTSYILASGTLAGKSVIDEVGRALDIPLQEVSKIKQEFETNEDATKKKYPDIFYYFDGLVGTVVNQSMHPAGIIASPINLVENYGTFWNKGKKILSINMEEVHEVSLVKYDILGLKNVQIIRDTCVLAGIPYPLSHEIDWEDKDVWDNMLISPVGIFQFESHFAFDSLKKYKPEKINHMSIVNSAIRPSGASYREGLLNHKEYHNPSKEIDELLKDNGNYLIFQEDIIKFLQQICGLSGSEADNVRRAIGRKDEERLQKSLPSILEGYCNVSKQPREVAEVEAKTFLKIIEDASNYMFGFNHSTGYSMLGYTCAFLRYKYPMEFVASLLNNSETEVDTANAITLAQQLNITISAPRFRHSRASYMFDKENGVIYKGLSSIKFLSEKCADGLYSLKDNRYDNFTDLLLDINKLEMDSRQLEILIKLEFFSEFGNIKELLTISNLFTFLKNGEAKQISAEKLDGFEYLRDIVIRNSELTESGKTYRKLDMKTILSECCDYIKEQKIKDIDIVTKITWQKDYLGYISFQSNKPSERYKLLVLELTPLKTRDKTKVYTTVLKCLSLGSGKINELKVWQSVFEKNKLHQYDIIFTKPQDYSSEEYNGVKSWRLAKYEKERKELQVDLV